MHCTKRLIALAALCCTLTLAAQSIDRKTQSAIANYFAQYEPEGITIGRCSLKKGNNSIVANSKHSTLTILVNRNFGHQLFTPQLTKKIYSDIKALLPKSFRNYKINILAEDQNIEQLIPNHLREGSIDKKRLWGDIDHKGEPWTQRVSNPIEPDAGLAGRHLAVWQSHGRYYKAERSRWQWQRPYLYCTTEDLFTQSVVVPFLIPMLQNAGAVVFTPRERDWQPHSAIADNDVPTLSGSLYQEAGKQGAWSSIGHGYAQLQESMTEGRNPFDDGTARIARTVSDSHEATATAQWTPNIPQTGDYAVYVSYRTTQESVPDAKYCVVYSGGIAEFRVNQQMGGGTWVYLGTFHFEQGLIGGQSVILTNQSRHSGVVCADAVRFGGGMGSIARGDSLHTSGMPCYLEGARYWAQTSGFPYDVYSPRQGENDYTDDINCRSLAINHLAGGSVYNPDSIGLGVPIELSMGVHSDAGIPTIGNYLGTLGIVTTDYNQKVLPSGPSRYTSRDLAHRTLANIKRDVSARCGSEWNVRGVWDRSYSESRLPVVPSMIVETLSHQHFDDMKLGHDPNFKFTLARALYKSILQYTAYQHGTKCVVQPLPVKNLRIEFNPKKENSLVVRWDPVKDPLEPGADPTEYVLYTRINNRGFDEGTRLQTNECLINIQPDIIYSFKVTAANRGGESLPSETLSAARSSNSQGTLLIVNGFHRLSGPGTIETADRCGFTLYEEAPVAYLRSPEYCGAQTEFSRSLAGQETGLGLSSEELEGKLIAGNSLDYAYTHGEAALANRYSFTSCSSEAVHSGQVELTRYPAVDYILGMEKEQPGGIAPFNCCYPYKSFTPAIMEQITRYCTGGGALLLSGAYVASDMQQSEQERNFIKNTLHLQYGGTNRTLGENVIFGSNLFLEIPRLPNEECYAVSNPDVLVPVAPAFTSFIYNDSRQSAGIAYQGSNRLIVTAFPLESIRNAQQRSLLMGAALKFLLPPQ